MKDGPRPPRRWFYTLKAYRNLVVMVKETAFSWIDENEKKITEISDKAWGFAEVGLQEYSTSDRKSVV